MLPTLTPSSLEQFLDKSGIDRKDSKICARTIMIRSVL